MTVLFLIIAWKYFFQTKVSFQHYDIKRFSCKPCEQSFKKRWMLCIYIKIKHSLNRTCPLLNGVVICTIHKIPIQEPYNSHKVGWNTQSNRFFNPCERVYKTKDTLNRKKKGKFKSKKKLELKMYLKKVKFYFKLKFKCWLRKKNGDDEFSDEILYCNVTCF